MLRHKLITAGIFALLLGAPTITMAQACSCGGAPLLSSLEIPSTPAGVWQLGFTYEFSSISDVFTGSKELADDVRSRRVHSGLLEINYGVTERISVSALFTLLQQERKTKSGSATSEFLRTRGVGDGVVLLKYSLIPSSVFTRRQVAIGGGVKIPFGQSSLTNNNTLLAADMQPGTGAWDFIVWGHAQQGFFNRFPVTVFSTLSYRLTGTSDRFELGSNGYEFGDELVTTLGINFSHYSKLNYNLSLRYRTTSPDEFNVQELPNSGGKWLNFVPGLNWNLSDKIGVRSEGEFPLHRELDGTQLTTNYTVSFSFSYTLAPSNKQPVLTF